MLSVASNISEIHDYISHYYSPDQFIQFKNVTTRIHLKDLTNTYHKLIAVYGFNV